MTGSFHPKHYQLDANGDVVESPSLMAWAMWYETADRKVARDRTGDFDVSTVFLGLDHGFEPDGKPVLWETCVFDHGKPTRYTMGGVTHESCESDVLRRYASRDDARRGHAETLDTCRALMKERIAQRKARKAQK